MDIMEELKMYLKQLKYPGIDLMRDEDMVNIFSRENRIYFLTWFVERWEPNIVLPIEKEAKISALADVLHSSGLCSEQDSIKFVRDSIQIKPNERLKIITRMLYNLQIFVSAKEESKQDYCDTNYAQSLHQLSKLDMNIFPELGPMQTREPEQRREKMRQIREEIEQLKHDIQSMDNHHTTEDRTNVETTDYDIAPIDGSQINISLDKLSHVLKLNEEETEGAFDNSFGSVVTDCAAKLHTVTKLFMNKNAINEFRVPVVDAIKCDDHDGLAEDVKRLALLSSEVVNDTNEFRAPVVDKKKGDNDDGLAEEVKRLRVPHILVEYVE